MLLRLTISFDPEERKALEQMANEDFRPPKEQLRWLLRQEAQRRGLLMAVTKEHQPIPSSKGAGCDEPVL